MHPPEYFSEAIKKIEKLHGSMAVLSRLNSLLRDINSDMSKTERLLASDGAIAALVIKLSNSPIYRRGAASTSLPMAMQKVGFNQILKMVGLALSKGVFMKDLEAYGITADQYWFTNYFTALFMEGEAQRLGMNTDDAYLIGLLHSIGKAVINELLSKEKIEIYWDPSIPSEVWEETMIGFRYDQAGAILLEKWGFAHSIYDKIEKQNSEHAKAEDPLLCMLDFSQQLLTYNTHDKPLDLWDFRIEHPYCQKHELTAEFLSDMMSRLLTTISGLKKVIGNL